MALSVFFFIFFIGTVLTGYCCFYCYYLTGKPGKKYVQDTVMKNDIEAPKEEIPLDELVFKLESSDEGY